MPNEMNDNPKVYLVAGLFNFIRKHWGMLEKLQTFLENNEDFDLKNTCSQLWLEYSAKLGEFSKSRTNDCVEELNAFFYKSAELMQATMDKKEEVAVNEVEVPKEAVAAPIVEESETVVEAPQAEAGIETAAPEVEAVVEESQAEAVTLPEEEAPKEEVAAPVVEETETVVEAPQAEEVAVAETTNPQAEEVAVAETTNPQAVAVAEVPKAEPVIAPEVGVQESPVNEVVATTPQAVETAPAPVAEAPQTEQVNVPVAAPVNIFQGTGVEVQPPLTPTNIPVQQSTSEGVIGNIPIIQGENKESETSVAVSTTSESENVLHFHSDGAKGRALLVTDKQKGNLSANGKAVVLPFPTSTEVVAGSTVVDNNAQNSGEIPSVEALTAQAVALNKAGNSEKAEEIMNMVHGLLEGNVQPEAGKQKVLVNTAA